MSELVLRSITLILTYLKLAYDKYLYLIIFKNIINFKRPESDLVFVVMDIVSSIAYTSFLTPLVIIGISFFVRNPTTPIRLIRYLTTIGFTVDLLCLFLGRRGLNTYPIGNVFLLFQTILLFFLYKDVLKVGKYISAIIFLYVVVFLLDYFFIHGPLTLNSYSNSLSALIFILFSLLYFRHLLIELPVDFVYRIPMVWINLGILVYYSGNLFLFGLNNYFTDGMEGNQRIVWALHNMLNIAKNIFFIISVWQSLPKTN